MAIISLACSTKQGVSSVNPLVSCTDMDCDYASNHCDYPSDHEDISNDYADHSSDTTSRLNSDSVGQVVGSYRTGRACMFAID